MVIEKLRGEKPRLMDESNKKKADAHEKLLLGMDKVWSHLANAASLV